METPSLPPETDSYLDFSKVGFDITRNLAKLDKLREAGEMDDETYRAELTKLVEEEVAYLTEAMQKFPKDFSMGMEAEDLARSLSGERKHDFALHFNEVLHDMIADPVRPDLDCRSLQRIIDLTVIADRVNDRNFYKRPNKPRQVGDAVIGRAVLNLLSFNEDPRSLRIPHRP